MVSASVVFEKFTGDALEFIDVPAVDAIDLRIICQKSADCLRPVVDGSRPPLLWDHIKYPYVG